MDSLITKTGKTGRFGNQLIMNVSMSLIARKFNLKIIYYDEEKITKLGIPLFHGENIYNKVEKLNKDNDFEYYYNLNNIDFNFCLEGVYLQTLFTSNLIYNFFRENNIMNSIIQTNPFKDRYNNNNDCFIHIRLTDAVQFSPGYKYYIKAINTIGFNNFNNLYISTDDFQNPIILDIINIVSQNKNDIILYNQDYISTIQFASTCKHLILSHGSFSSLIGWLGFNSSVYYPEYEQDKIWYGDLFSISGWNKISNYR